MRPIVLAIVALLSLVLAGCKPSSNSVRVSMTISAIGATADTFYIPNPQPIWSFAITNTGTNEAQWQAGIEVKGGDPNDYSLAGGHIDWPEGILGPGKSSQTNMIVPAKAGTTWRAYLEFHPTTDIGYRELQRYDDQWH